MLEREPEALQTDAYLERLLASRGEVVPVPVEELEAVDPALRAAAGLLRRTLVRFHPSFRFEERLARRLLAEAAAPGAGDAPRGELLAFPDAGELAMEADRRSRTLLLGGAIASGVSLASIAGLAGAVIARRRARAAQISAPTEGAL